MPSSPPRHPPCPSIAQHRSRPRANPTDMPGRPMDRPCALPTMDRSSVYKSSRPELKFHHSTPPRLHYLSPYTPPSLVHRQEGGIAAGELLPPCIVLGAPPLPRRSTTNSWPCGHSLSLSLLSLTSALPHRRRTLTSSPFRAQVCRQELAVDLPCPRRRSCSPPTEPTTPAPVT